MENLLHPNSDHILIKMVFCTCETCKALNIEAGGREVAPVTKWRHNKKENDWYNYLDNFDLTIQETEL